MAPERYLTFHLAKPTCIQARAKARMADQREVQSEKMESQSDDSFVKCIACEEKVTKETELGHYVKHYFKDPSIKTAMKGAVLRCTFCRAVVCNDFKSLKSHLEMGSKACLEGRIKNKENTEPQSNQSFKPIEPAPPTHPQTCVVCDSIPVPMTHYKTHFTKKVDKKMVSCNFCKIIMEENPKRLKFHLETQACRNARERAKALIKDLVNKQNSATENSQNNEPGLVTNAFVYVCLLLVKFH